MKPLLYLFLAFITATPLFAASDDYELVIVNRSGYKIDVKEKERDEAELNFQIIQTFPATKEQPFMAEKMYDFSVYQNRDGSEPFPDSMLSVRYWWTHGASKRALTLYIT